ncbi:MAG: family 10 glycosylhydrolase [Pyrinomonadaceae bacterium]|nr:family 10 glycosylhydrolase [Pyrinomonadaceae bacterium]
MPKVAREFRGMWIATVANLDFPSKQNLTAEQQKAELIKLLDLATELRMNAVIFQIRSMGDAVYYSDIEPASPFITGQMGENLPFDPLKFLLDEAHARGILVHVWLNPYRASSPFYTGELPPNHVANTHPEWIRPYSNYKMLDPGLREVQDYLVKIVNDVVTRYDVDGVHFDDYFYPYPDAKQSDFPDEETYKTYKQNGGKLGKEDWRRKNVDDLIQTVSAEIKKIKPNVMFGISPFGIWKANDIDIIGTSSYDAQFADSRKWFQEGWVDYLSPQLYWSTTKNGQKFPVLFGWWKNENKKKKHLWVGLAPYKIGDEKYPDYSSKEIETQIGMIRGTLTDNAGAIHFRALSIAENKDGIKDYLRDKVYRGNAIIPVTPWLDTTAPTSAELTVSKQSDGTVQANWKGTGAKSAFRWILYWNDGQGWKPTIIPQQTTRADLPPNMNVQKVGIAAVDRLGNISEATIKEVK